MEKVRKNKFLISIIISIVILLTLFIILFFIKDNIKESRANDTEQIREDSGMYTFFEGIGAYNFELAGNHNLEIGETPSTYNAVRTPTGDYSAIARKMTPIGSEVVDLYNKKELCDYLSNIGNGYRNPFDPNESYFLSCNSIQTFQVEARKWVKVNSGISNIDNDSSINNLSKSTLNIGENGKVKKALLLIDYVISTENVNNTSINLFTEDGTKYTFDPINNNDRKTLVLQYQNINVDFVKNAVTKHINDTFTDQTLKTQVINEVNLNQFHNSTAYSSVINITDIISEHKGGDYYVNFKNAFKNLVPVQTTVIANWAIVVVEENEEKNPEKNKYIRLDSNTFDLSGATKDISINSLVDLKTDGGSTSQLIGVVDDGDQKTLDSFNVVTNVNGSEKVTPLVFDGRETNDFFNSTISSKIDREPKYNNSYEIDIFDEKITNDMLSGSSKVSFRVDASGELLIMKALGVAAEIKVPKINVVPQIEEETKYSNIFKNTVTTTPVEEASACNAKLIVPIDTKVTNVNSVVAYLVDKNNNKTAISNSKINVTSENITIDIGKMEIGSYIELTFLSELKDKTTLDQTINLDPIIEYYPSKNNECSSTIDETLKMTDTAHDEIKLPYKLTVHHYYVGTTTKVADSTETYLRMDDRYQTQQATEFYEPIYKLNSVSGNTSGTITSTNKNPVVIYYYDYININLEIEKTDPDGNKLTGAVFGIYEDEECSKLIVEGNSFSNLIPKKTYYLKEIKAPSGYVLINKPIKIETNSQGEVTTEDNYKITKQEDKYIITIINEKDIILPKTGSIGTREIIVLGACISMIAMISIFIYYKRKII